MNDERDVLYLSFVLASIISDSDIYSDPRSHITYTCLQEYHKKHYLNVINVTYHNYFISKLYELYRVILTLIIAKSNIYDNDV